MNTLIVTSGPTVYSSAPGMRMVRPCGNVCGFAADMIEVRLCEPPPGMLRFMEWFRDEVATRARPSAQFRLPAWLVRELQK